MLGKCFNVKGVSLKIASPVKVKGEYIFECDKCSKDDILWKFGSIKSSVFALNRGQIPCGCSKSPRWKEWQYKVLVERVCKEKDYIFKGWAEEYRKSSTYVNLVNARTSSEWSSTSISKLLRGRGDPKERTAALVNSRRILDEVFVANLEGNHLYPSGTVFTRDTSDTCMCHIYCPICSEDEYVKLGLCSGVFRAQQKDIKKGVVSCRCSSHYYWTKEQYEYRVKLKLGISSITWTEGFKNKRSKFSWLCQLGHFNTSRLDNVLINESGCSTCSLGGFSKDSPANFYVVRWYDKEISYIKFGITNRPVLERIKEQNAHTKLSYEIIEVYHDNDGGNVADCESFIKKSSDIISNVCPKKVLPSGYTETVHDTLFNIEKILTVINKFNLNSEEHTK